jgi:hypothetical protein
MTHADILKRYRAVLKLVTDAPEITDVSRQTVLTFLTNLVKDLETMEC